MALRKQTGLSFRTLTKSFILFIFILYLNRNSTIYLEFVIVVLPGLSLGYGLDSTPVLGNLAVLNMEQIIEGRELPP